MRHPDGDPPSTSTRPRSTRPSRRSRAPYGLLVEFFGALGSSRRRSSGTSLFLLGQVGAAESIRARWPLVHNIARASGLTAGLVRRRPPAADPVERGRRGDRRLARRSTCSRGDVGRAVGHDRAPTRGERSATSSGSGSPSPRRSRSSRRSTSAPATATSRTTPVAGRRADERSFDEHRAVGAFTHRRIDADPAGTSGLDGHLALTSSGSPAAARSHTCSPSSRRAALRRRRWHRVHERAVHARARGAGRRRTSLIVGGHGWDFELGDVVRAVAVVRPARRDKALEFGERDGPTSTIDTIALRAELSAKPVDPPRVQGGRPLAGAHRRRQLHLAR